MYHFEIIVTVQLTCCAVGTQLVWHRYDTGLNPHRAPVFGTFRWPFTFVVFSFHTSTHNVYGFSHKHPNLWLIQDFTLFCTLYQYQWYSPDHSILYPIYWCATQSCLWPWYCRATHSLFINTCLPAFFSLHMQPSTTEAHICHDFRTFGTFTYNHPAWRCAHVDCYASCQRVKISTTQQPPRSGWTNRL